MGGHVEYFALVYGVACSRLKRAFIKIIVYVTSGTQYLHMVPMYT